ncbi:MAG: molybdopterin converting factor subunit 1 [Geminicoccaceae bacterium]|jgi:molybdopterin synthase sulfur carrier subunit|nr:molybdopterin converting factor subunit 1 [Geminicoccaceae bacterium]MCB9967288.1 molybdopterin converting factor subunit 1 [Geminicoccaceae bacterium]HRY26281.1 molybdopterin converting factor subunit 1 [Geminicoccaceae bacterium]
MRVRYFAWLKQRTGCAEEELDLPAEVLTVADLIGHLGARHPRFAEAAAGRGVVRCAIDQQHVEREAPLAGAREVAFFPPVTGG